MLVSRIAKEYATQKVEVDRQNSPRPERYASQGIETEAGERITPENARCVATAYRAGNLISDDIAKMPLQQIRRIGNKIEQVQADGRMYNTAFLLEVSPNQWGWTPFLFKKAISQWVIYYGNSYVWSPPIWPPEKFILPADRTYPVFSMEGELWYYTRFSNGEEAYIPAVEMLHTLINPDSTGFMGRGVVTFARETIGRQTAAYKTQSKFYRQGFTPAAYISVDAVLKQDERDAYRNAYEQSMSGTKNAYRLAVLDKKITKFEPITMKLSDAQFLESIHATDKDIANFFGVSEAMLNGGKQSYESNDQKYIEYLQGTLDAYLVPLEQGARIRWLSRAEQGNNYFKFVRESLLRMDAKGRAETNEIKIRSGQMTPNEAREKDDVSGYEDGDRFWMTRNNAPMDMEWMAGGEQRLEIRD